MILGYHIIFAAYGFWLPNDPRGSGSDYVGSRDLYRYGPATRVETRRSVAHRPHNRELRRAAKQALHRPPVSFTGLQARAVGDGFRAYVRRADLLVWACAILPDHVHLVLGPPRYRVEQVVGLLKGEATTALLAAGLHPFGDQAGRDRRVPTCWGGRCWKVYLHDEAGVRRAIRYVENNPVKEGKPPQRWSFVTPYAPTVTD